MSDSLSEIRDDERWQNAQPPRKTRRTYKPKTSRPSHALQKRLEEFFGTKPATIKSPILRLSIDATQGTPAIATMLMRVLEEAGAKVMSKNKSLSTKNVKNVNLRGLTIHIGQLTWVREEEAERW